VATPEDKRINGPSLALSPGRGLPTGNKEEDEDEDRREDKVPRYDKDNILILVVIFSITHRERFNKGLTNGNNTFCTTLVNTPPTTVKLVKESVQANVSNPTGCLSS